MNTKNRISQIESREEVNAKAISEMINKLKFQIGSLEYQIQCGAKYGHRFTLSWERHGNFHFRCINCDLEYTNTKENLTGKEAKLADAIFPNQKEKESNE